MTDAATLQRVREALAKLGKTGGMLRPTNLVERVAKQAKISQAETSAAMTELFEQGELRCSDWHKGHPYANVALNLAQAPPSPAILRWQAAMQEAAYSDAEQVALESAGETLAELDASDLARLAQGLKQLKADQDSLAGESRYPVSARYLLGSSKLLDALPTPALAAFGIDLGRLNKAVSYVIVAGPPEPKCVILVENPQAMETALLADLPHIAWVATFGYGLSMAGEEYGRQLASILEDPSRRICPLIRAGAPPALDRLLSHPRLHFWGDLDPEGLRIYARIRARYPSLTLSALYTPMLAQLDQDGKHHPYAKLVAKEGQARWNTDDPVLQHLLGRCQVRGVDQETLGSDVISRFAGRAL